MNTPCEDRGGKYCMCDACQSMRKMLEGLTDSKYEDIMTKSEAKKVFEEMSRMLSSDMDNPQ